MVKMGASRGMGKPQFLWEYEVRDFSMRNGLRMREGREVQKNKKG